jgi:hypothetical protein
MSDPWRVRFAAWALCAAWVAGLACAARGQADLPTPADPPADELGRVRAAVEQALVSQPPRGYAAIPPGVRLLSVAEDAAGTIVLNLSGELLASPLRVIEDSVRQILLAASSAREPREERVDDFRILVNGVTLESYLP